MERNQHKSPVDQMDIAKHSFVACMQLLKWKQSSRIGGEREIRCSTRRGVSSLWRFQFSAGSRFHTTARRRAAQRSLFANSNKLRASFHMLFMLFAPAAAVIFQSTPSNSTCEVSWILREELSELPPRLPFTKFAEL